MGMNLEQERIYTSHEGVEIFQAPHVRGDNPVLQMPYDQLTGEIGLREQSALVYAWMHAKPVEGYFEDRPSRFHGALSVGTLYRGMAALDLFRFKHPDVRVLFACDPWPPLAWGELTPDGYV